MAATTHGLSSITYGNPTITGFVVQSSSVSTKPAVTAEVFDEAGIRVHSRYDDITNELSLDVIVTSGTIPTVGTVFTFNTVKYEITGVDVKTANKDFVKVSIKGKNSSGITLT